LVTASYRASYFNLAEGAAAVATARAGNVIGGGDWSAHRLAADAARAFARGQPLMIRHPQAVRPWQHVLEPLAGYLMLARALCVAPARFARSWNFGPDPSKLASVGELADRMAAEWGGGASWREASDDLKPNKEAGLLLLDPSLAGRELGWRPVLDLGQAVAATMHWYRAFSAEAGADDLLALTRDQISRFSRLMGTDSRPAGGDL
jgi:CDP-glucose 4,6-dehydratase